MNVGVGLGEIFVFLLIYGLLMSFLLRSMAVSRKRGYYLKLSILLVLYISITIFIWTRYKAEENHVNSHSGLDPISYTNEALLMIGGFTAFNLLLIVVGVYLNKRSNHT
ncbi:peptide ABC transporter permease [Paenalkalicoccus suaedae]|uniref:Peptide ABC transporter permease n=1 Tax=Paenalkalicoccus suaedae TaxID=2592382 RepID=A0A859FIG8_9BACI|nr:peptide ABC transporter permease [Paenalkalicoccus suaedae]QKS72859.1 peptide ABC transporter permease [Paenalkalicoccus suaedae]